MTNPVEFKVAAIRAGISLKDIAANLGIKYATLNKKINNVTEFKSSELEKLSRILKIEEDRLVFDRIFYAEKVDFNSTSMAVSRAKGG